MPGLTVPRGAPDLELEPTPGSELDHGRRVRDPSSHPEAAGPRWASFSGDLAGPQRWRGSGEAPAITDPARQGSQARGRQGKGPASRAPSSGLGSVPRNLVACELGGAS